MGFFIFCITIGIIFILDYCLISGCTFTYILLVGGGMNPLRYWMRLTIASNPKKQPRSLKDVVSLFLANLIVLVVVASVSLASHILTVLIPALAPEITILTLAVMFFMMFSLFLRMRRVTMWRQKQLTRF